MYKVLIIDDEKPAVVAINALIEKRPNLAISQTYTAANGKEGLASLREISPHIVFVDMHMPVMNGISFLQEATKEFHNCKYIVVSGYDDFEYTKAAIKSGVSDYVLKPIDENELYSTLDKIIIELNKIHGNIDRTNLTEEIMPNQVISIIKDYIDKNYCNEIKISMFTKKYFLSKEYLSKLFKKKYGKGIYEYGLELRMNRSKLLLIDNNLLIQDIAERLGYSNSNYFSKAFKNHFGISPSQFRSKNCVTT